MNKRDLKKLAKGQLAADEWNAKNPVGTPVKYFPLIGCDDPPALLTVTRTPAWILGHGQPVVSVVGMAGGVALSHLQLMNE